MDRLTRRETTGEATALHGDCGWYGSIVQKLAAYEDTGLEPQETTPRLRELAQADREWRVVVLPCKVGDTVYRTCRRYWAEGREVAGQNTYHVFFGGTYVLRTEDREEAMAVYRLCRRQGEAVMAGEERNGT